MKARAVDRGDGVTQTGQGGEKEKGEEEAGEGQGEG